MSGLASKQQSLKIFEKLKTKPANKVREVIMQCALAFPRKLNAISNYMELPQPPAAVADFAYHTDLFRLWTEESNMDIRTSGHLPVP